MIYPLKFKPRFLEKMWGGRKFETVLGKALPSSAPIGESWELYDFPPGALGNNAGWESSVVADGPDAGKTLHELIVAHGEEICGDVPLLNGNQFPILIKFLDAKENLSVQVHPDAAYCQGHPGAFLKTEAWYVLQADEGAFLYKDLKPGTTREAFEKSIAQGTCEAHLGKIKGKVGDCHFLESGTVHALCAGLLVAEVQTPSDTTFRVYDFNRVDPSTGKTRTLHVKEAMECIHFDAAKSEPQARTHVAGVFTTVSHLATCEFFKMEKVRFSGGVEQVLAYGQPVVWMVLEGDGEIRVEGLKTPIRFGKGDTLLLPAAMKNPILKTNSDCVWIETTFPALKK